MDLATENLIMDTLKEEKVTIVVSLPEDPSAKLSERMSHDNYFKYIRVVNESHGIAITAGAALVGRKSVFITGIAGLLVGAWALSMMGMLYRIPFVMLVSFRGDLPDKSGIPGEHLHVFRTVAKPLLDSLQIPYKIVSEKSKLQRAIRDAYNAAHSQKIPVALLLTEEILW
jgi:sulfopyruvate decarboxylase subunit alpha